jgi:hypothetical protein
LATLITFRFLEVIFLVVQMTTELGNLIVLDLEAVEQDDFNKNMKIALSAEFRFKILGELKGAFFAEVIFECLR